MLCSLVQGPKMQSSQCICMRCCMCSGFKWDPDASQASATGSHCIPLLGIDGGWEGAKFGMAQVGTTKMC